jgi:hypothetical protein
MIYTFTCPQGHANEVQAPISKGPPSSVTCWCRLEASRDWQADAPMIDTSACRDHDFIPEQMRVASNDGFGIGKAKAAKKVDAYKQHIQKRRSQLADGNKGSIKQTHAVPAELYHGKIRETGDKNYWQDRKNLDRHKSCKVT